VTARAVLLALLLIPVNFYWTVQLEVVRYSFPTYAAPFYNVVFLLFLLTLLNLPLRRWWPRVALTWGELLTIYALQSVASALCSVNMMEILVTLLGHPFRFATPENQWEKLFQPYLPRWLTVRDEVALKHYYEGHSSLYRPEHLTAWAGPVAAWTVFTVVLLFVLLCLCVLLRRQWIERERLTYPIIHLPLEMTSPTAGFFRHRMMWLGFAVAGAIALINGLSYLYPAIPTIPVKRRSIGHYFVTPPWDALGGLQVAFYPFGLGLGFLMPLDLSFSGWIFFLFYRAQLVLSRATGWGQETGFPYPDDQAFGAYVALLAMALWAGREHWKGIWREGRRGPGREEDFRAGKGNEREPLSYRVAVLGVVLGLGFLVAFAVAAGLPVGIAVLFFTIYFALATMITRIRAEFGLPIHDLHNMGPHHVMTRLAGTEAFSPRTLTIFSLFHWFNRVYASHPMPHQLEGFKLAERAQMNPRRLFVALSLTAAVATVATFWVLLDLYYRVGAETGKVEIWALGFGREVYGRLESWIKTPTEREWPHTIAMGCGFGFALLLGALRLRWIGAPLHPLAYAVSHSWGPAQIWTCLLVASLTKALLLRCGGLPLYRRALGFFLGLILGDFVVGSLWTLVGVAGGFRTYDFWP